MITELIREEMKGFILHYYNKDEKSFFKTRLIFGVLFALIGAMFVFYIDKLVYMFIPVVAFIVGYKYPYYTLYVKKQKDDYLNSYLFPEFIQTFIALIPTSGNVYQALVECVPYTREPLRARLEELIRNIEDNNVRDHYLTFADYVGSSEAYMMMDMIYQFSQFGIKRESLKELQDYIAEIQKNRVDALIVKKISNMEGLGYIPIFISMFTVIGFAAVLIFYYFGGVTDSISTIG